MFCIFVQESTENTDQLVRVCKDALLLEIDYSRLVDKSCTKKEKEKKISIRKTSPGSWEGCT